MPPTDVVDIKDEEAEMEEPPLVRKNYKKSNVGKGKAPESEIPSEDDKKVEKEKGEKRPLRKRKVYTSEELGSSKKPKVESSELEMKETLKSQKVLMGRVFDPEYAE